MSETTDNRLAYQALRALFVGGFALDIVLMFVPSIEVTTAGFLGFGGTVISMSGLDVIRRLFQSGEVGLAMLLVLLFCAQVAFLILAMKYPKRWVFVAGSCFAVFLVILGLFAGSSDNVEEYFVPRVLSYVATALQLAGFWVKPPDTK